ncbi:STE/STE20/MSN protein kinase [Salpingoeca rosetta]|uniref:non-specific serine/threonine protein kinase n=1 Tax=Salpingoeca rosetta (strain ATCC 50818 / BSB-021) TaxID=946362 RepID=F2USE6_SALR5|nr:STE/STE20/MSN protein kinase [Salpingoeca rosetta]XP_012493101.1 STE/STE20/MSN protein kinase, variant [Salpingoeca rosetta]EGD81055.1 STE/STE20/MSN protein kinase, variant [Salpingoeca rosetta]EGD81056.1 STE/STE20/MSN protein kinase [Salpingoeca rosetta]|eukprot:XP_004987925.1 STE/STE20/MSN protein kinase [Salpingoeca rosetta]
MCALRDLPRPGGLFQLMDIVGTGNYGQVFRAMHTKTKELVAVKIMDLIEEEEEDIKVEIDILKKFGTHKNLTTFYGVFLAEPDGNTLERHPQEKLWLVMELCDAGSVIDLAEKLKPKAIPENIIAYIIRETTEAIRFLHKNLIIHRDIKGQNVLMNAHGEVKLVDFGVSAMLKDKKDKRNSYIGTPYWMAPEVIACDDQRDSLYDQRCDVWALGIFAIELAECEPPLADHHPMRASFLIPRNPPPTLKEEKKWSEQYIDFVAKCLVKDFEKRPTTKKILDHTFLKSVNAKRQRAALADLIEKVQRGHKRKDEDELVSLPSPGPVVSESPASFGSNMDWGELSRPVSQLSSRAHTPTPPEPLDVNMQGLAGPIRRTSRVPVSNSRSSNGPTMLDSILTKEQRAQLPDATIAQRRPRKTDTGFAVPDAFALRGTDVVVPSSPERAMNPQIRKLHKRFNSEILCAAFWGANLLVGTKHELCLLDRSGPGRVFPLIGRRRFQQLAVLESLGVMVTICGKKNKLRTYNLNYFKSLILRQPTKKQTLYQDVNKHMHCTHFSLARHDRLRFLCVASGKSITIYLWAHKPYYKFMVFKEFAVPHEPVLVNLKVIHEEELKVVFASKIGFHAVDVNTGAVINMYVHPNPSKGSITPHSIMQLDHDEYMLLFDRRGVRIDYFGEKVAEVSFAWESSPSSAVLLHPDQVLGWGSKSIETRDIRTGELLGSMKHKQAVKLRFLCARANKLFFASVKQGGSTQIYFMTF